MSIEEKFKRVCPEHGDPVLYENLANGATRYLCPKGHRVNRPVVADMQRRVVVGEMATDPGKGKGYGGATGLASNRKKRGPVEVESLAQSYRVAMPLRMLGAL